MTKLQSSFKNMILSLTLISVGMSAALGVVYSLTKESIVKTNLQNEMNALTNVLPPFDNNPLDSAITIEGQVFYKAKKGNNIVGYACKAYTDKGFNGKIVIMTGFLPDGTINKTIVLEQKETPGLGDKINTSWKDQFNGKNPSKFNLKVKKDGGDVDAISAATISSRAFCDAIDKAYRSLMKNILKKADSEINTNTDKNDSCNITDVSIIVAAKPLIFQFADKSIFNNVLAPFNNDPLKDFKSIDGLDLYFGKMNGKITGCAVTTFSDNGFAGKIILLAGFTPEGNIKSIEVIQQNETKGYGSRMTESEFKDQFNGKNPATFKLKVLDDNGDVDAISGATISSRAVCDALQKAYNAFLKGIKP